VRHVIDLRAFARQRTRARRALGLALTLAALTGCRDRMAELVHFDASTAPPPPPPLVEEPHQVHFTYTGPDAVTFNWAQGGNTVRLWAKDVPLRVVEAHAPSVVPSASPGPWREATLDGLVPGKEYFYQVGNPVRPEPISFRAPPPHADNFTFAAVGDVGAAADFPAAKSLHRILRIADPSFVLVLGDLTYATAKTTSAIDRHFDEVMAWSRRAAYMPAWGNHEWQEGDGEGLLANYKSRFALPNAAAARGAPGATSAPGKDWYWFDYGPVRFIVYPEPYTRDTWTDWATAAERLFASAQQDPAVRFVVTAGHRPAYSSGRHAGDEQLRTILDGFGRRFSKYVLNLAGHSHNYERTKPQAHVTHVTAGIGGGALEHASTPCMWESCTPPAFSARRALHHGFVKLFVHGDAIRLEAVCGASSQGEDDVYCGQGEIFDSVEIRSGGDGESGSARKRPAQASSN
jgi:hypothetical protein